MSKKKPAYVDGKFVGNTLSISVKPHYQKEYEFLKSHHNRSGLICELVRQYLEGGEMSMGYQQHCKPTSPQPVPQVTSQQEDEVKKDKVEDDKKSNNKNDVDKGADSEKDNGEGVVNNSQKVPVMAMPAFLNG